ncbi:hypothetical protein [Actinoplanes sp. NPDC048796]|uniref:hypothetical protein n=1 Tax=Actinoplanes sp. NPDC048796 TaxID=3155640 RepID=UPI003401C751
MDDRQPLGLPLLTDLLSPRLTHLLSHLPDRVQTAAMLWMTYTHSKLGERGTPSFGCLPAYVHAVAVRVKSAAALGGNS